MSNYHYTGNDTLEIMDEAKNYNAFLEKLVLKYISHTDFILDIGAGIGTFAKKFLRKGYQVHCIEPDTQQVNYMKNFGLTADISVENMENNSVDFIYSLNVLEHIENDIDALKLWRTKLKQGGCILIYVPAFNLLYFSFDKSVGHYRRYRKKMLVNKMQSAGFFVEKVRYADSLGFFASLLYKWVNKGDGKITKNSLIFYDRFVFPFNRLFDFLCCNILGKNVYVVGKCL
jgi:2-polyprenyl-3-methyl-5-hydroxy-6-metoxy-1,4-benzoquinol methylase